MSKLKLFKEILSCKSCLYSWEGYAHGFSRGHSVLEKSGRVLFIADDIWYLFPEGTSFDIDALFFNLGWRQIESCPKCKSIDLFPPLYTQESSVDIECLSVERRDFVFANEQWVLSDTAMEIYA